MGATSIQKTSAVRWLEVPGLDPRRNLALEEAVYLRNQGVTVRVWENKRSVIIGRSQRADLETDVGYCEANGVGLVRRFTGGGAVYNGPGNLNWSIFATADTGLGRACLEGGGAAFRTAAEMLVSALGSLGVEAFLDEPNSLRTAGGKVSGMAAFVARDRMVCHGTLLLNADLEQARRLTTPREAGGGERYVRSRDTVIANAGVEAGAFRDALKEVVAPEDGQLVAVSAASVEEVRTAELLLEKYSSDAWNLGDPYDAGGRG